MEAFGKNLRRVREERGISQTELFKRSGVAQSTISELEHGKRRPHRGTVGTLAEALGVEASALLAEDAEEQAQDTLRRVWANLGMLEHYMQHPPDEGTWDRALDEYFGAGSAPLSLALQLMQRGRYDERLVADLIRAA